MDARFLNFFSFCVSHMIELQGRPINQKADADADKKMTCIAQPIVKIVELELTFY